MDFRITLIISGVLFFLAFAINLFAFILEKVVDNKKLKAIKNDKLKSENK